MSSSGAVDRDRVGEGCGRVVVVDVDAGREKNACAVSVVATPSNAPPTRRAVGG